MFVFLFNFNFSLFFFLTFSYIIFPTFISGYTGEISAGIAGGALLLLGVVSLVLYRNWRYEQELDSLLWKVDFKEIQMHENDKDSSSQKQTRVSDSNGVVGGRE